MNLCFNQKILQVYSKALNREQHFAAFVAVGSIFLTEIVRKKHTEIGLGKRYESLLSVSTNTLRKSI